MADKDITDLLEWWYSKPDTWAGTYKEDDDGVVTLTLFNRKIFQRKESTDDQLQRARGRPPRGDVWC